MQPNQQTPDQSDQHVHKRRRKRMSNPTSKGELVGEGICLALPLCLPGQSVPPPAGETAMTCLAYDPAGSVYCGTAGAKAHVLAAVTHRDSGIIHDLGAVPDADEILALAVAEDSEETFWALANGPDGAALWAVPRFSVSFCIQEWFVARYPLAKVCDVAPGRRVLSAVASADGKAFHAITDDGELFHLEIATQQSVTLGSCGERVGFLPGLFLDRAGRLWGSTDRGRFWRFDPVRSEIDFLGEPIPCGAGRRHHARVSAWAQDPVSGTIYAGGEPDGFLFRLDGETGRAVTLGKPTLNEGITCLTVANDGRVYGMAGSEEEMAHLFCYDPREGSMRDLGTPVSVLTARQYGYHFRCALTAPDGEVYFGQHERVNHLWMYFPATPQRRPMDDIPY